MSENLPQVTLCLVINNLEKKLLLGMKNKSRFGGGKFNGPGGKKDYNESIEQATIRELKEEAGLIAELEDIQKVAEINFYFAPGQEKFNQTVIVYKLLRWKGEVKNSDEMIWDWFSLEQIPYDRMWDGDKYWMPLVLAGKRLKGSIYFNNERKVRDKDLVEVEVV